MKVTPTELPEVLQIEPDVFRDPRGAFLETWSRSRYAAAGLDVTFAQDNLSSSSQGTLRGLHLQHPHGQGKLAYVVDGEVYDVVVDVRVGSPRHGRWVGAVLSGANLLQLYIPPGFAHGFCVMSERAVFAYKCTEPYHPEAEIGIAWNDPELAIEWPVRSPILSPKDGRHPVLRDIEPARLPHFRRDPLAETSSPTPSPCAGPR